MAIERYAPDVGELPPEAREVVTEVRARMDRWIDEKVDGLRNDLIAEVNKASQDLGEHVHEVGEELRLAREGMESVLGQIEVLSLELESGDGETLENAIEKTRSVVAAVKAELEARERRWRGLGESLANAAIKAVSTAAGIPL